MMQNENEVNFFPNEELDLFSKRPSFSESLKEWALSFRDQFHHEKPSEIQELVAQLDALSQRPIHSIFQY